MKRSHLLLLFALAANLAFAVKPEYKGSVKAEEFHVRDGIGHVMEKIRAGKPIAIACIAGSITEMGGWRANGSRKSICSASSRRSTPRPVARTRRLASFAPGVTRSSISRTFSSSARLNVSAI